MILKEYRLEIEGEKLMNLKNSEDCNHDFNKGLSRWVTRNKWAFDLDFQVVDIQAY